MDHGRLPDRPQHHDGGPAGLIADLLADDRLDARQVRPGEDATPPGFDST